MPLLIAVLVVLLFTGGLQSPNTSSRPVDESDVIISTVSGGLARSVERDSGPSTPLVTVTNTNTNTNTNVTPDQPPSEPVTTPTVEVAPILDTLSAQNVKANSVTLRGEIDFVGESYPGKLYFVYSEKASDVRSLSSNIAQIPVSGGVRGDGVYTRIVYGLYDETTYYYRVCFDASKTTCGEVTSFTTVEGYGYSSNSSYRAPTASTRRAEQIQGEYATLFGYYRLNDAEYTTAFFVYGEDWDLVNEVPEEYDLYSDVREEGDDLQKVKAKSNMTSDGELEKEIDDLETSTTYYYRFCIDYDDVKTGMACGTTMSLETKSKQKDLPEVNSTQGTRSGDNANLSTVIDMNDYRNGHGFVVYGTDETRVDRVNDLDEFARVNQYGDLLQRLSIDDNLDSRETVSVTVYDVLPETYYYMFCVEYEAENDYGNDDLFLACGDLKTF